MLLCILVKEIDMPTQEPKINFYCDESCHLEHDHAKYMVLGTVYCLKDDLNFINQKIKEIKIKNKVTAFSEVKWSKLSKCNIQLYKDLLEFFFDKNNNLSFRAIIINKNELNHKKFKQTHEDFYYKMYYYLLQYKIQPLMHNKIYIDEKDTRNAQRIKKLTTVLKNKFYDYDNNKILPIQVIKSHEIQIMQITDILTGAISYCLNNKDKINQGKTEIINYIEQNINFMVNKMKNFHGMKFDLFYFKKAEQYDKN